MAERTTLPARVENLAGQCVTGEYAREAGEYFAQRWQEGEPLLRQYSEECRRIEAAYAARQEDFDDAMVIPILNPNVEGQVALLSDRGLSVHVRASGPADGEFTKQLQKAASLIAEKNGIKAHIKEGARRYLLYGMGAYAFGWEAGGFGGRGLPRWRSPDPRRILIDPRVTSLLELQQAEYIIEQMGSFDVSWAAREYGGAAAALLPPGDGSFELLHVWTRRSEGRRLQLIEMEPGGQVLRWSDPVDSYYQYVDNLYPYAFFRLYPREGSLYGFGDGRLLAGIQDTVNRLYKELLTAVKFQAQTRTFVDPAAMADLSEFDSDPSHPIVASDPQHNILFAQGQGINPVVFDLVENLLKQAERVTRFSSIMSGVTGGGYGTATQYGLQVAQGGAGINDKRGDISQAVAYGLRYCLMLGLEFFGEGFWCGPDAAGKYEYLDFERLRRVPVSPGLPNTARPVDFDIKVSIGEGLPTSRTELYNLVLALSKVELPDEHTGKLRPLLSFGQVRSMVEELLGLPLPETGEPGPEPLSRDASGEEA